MSFSAQILGSLEPPSNSQLFFYHDTRFGFPSDCLSYERCMRERRKNLSYVCLQMLMKCYIFSFFICFFFLFLFSTNAFIGSICLFLSCTGNVIFDGADFFGGRKFFAGRFLAKTIQNPDFFTKQLLLCRTSDLRSILRSWFLFITWDFSDGKCENGSWVLLTFLHFLSFLHFYLLDSFHQINFLHEKDESRKKFLFSFHQLDLP